AVSRRRRHAAFGLADVNVAVSGSHVDFTSRSLHRQLAISGRRAQSQAGRHRDRELHVKPRVLEASLLARAFAPVDGADRRAGSGLLHVEADVARLAATAHLLLGADFDAVATRLGDGDATDDVLDGERPAVTDA